MRSNKVRKSQIAPCVFNTRSERDSSELWRAALQGRFPWMFPWLLLSKYEVLHLLLDGRRHLAQVDSSPAGFEILFGDPLLGEPADKQCESESNINV